MQQDSRREALDLMRQSVARGVNGKNLPGNPLLDDVFRSLFAEQAAYLDVMEEEGSIKLLHDVQRKLSQALQKAGDSGELDTLVGTPDKVVAELEKHWKTGSPGKY